MSDNFIEKSKVIILTTVTLEKFGKHFGMFCLLCNRLCTEQAFHLDEGAIVLQNCEFLALRKTNTYKTFNNNLLCSKSSSQNSSITRCLVQINYLLDT